MVFVPHFPMNGRITFREVEQDQFSQSEPSWNVGLLRLSNATSLSRNYLESEACGQRKPHTKECRTELQSEWRLAQRPTSGAVRNENSSSFRQTTTRRRV